MKIKLFSDAICTSITAAKYVAAIALAASATTTAVSITGAWVIISASVGIIG